MAADEKEAGLRSTLNWGHTVHDPKPSLALSLSLSLSLTLTLTRWEWAGPRMRMITMGRPGATEAVERAARRAGVDLDAGRFIMGPELPDISSSEAREALAKVMLHNVITSPTPSPNLIPNPTPNPTLGGCDPTLSPSPNPNPPLCPGRSRRRGAVPAPERAGVVPRGGRLERCCTARADARP